MSDRSPVTTHVLDTALGRPAMGVGVTLYRGGEKAPLAKGQTNRDGRVEGLLPAGEIEPGDYRLHFDTAEHFRRQNITTFYPTISIEFTVTKPDDHYHVPLLLSPYSYSTYRGS